MKLLAAESGAGNDPQDDVIGNALLGQKIESSLGAVFALQSNAAVDLLARLLVTAPLLHGIFPAQRL
ncbi:MAG: hypothetical protein WKG03_22620, partial [Telluria sp.]